MRTRMSGGVGGVRSNAAPILIRFVIPRFEGWCMLLDAFYAEATRKPNVLLVVMTELVKMRHQIYNAKPHFVTCDLILSILDEFGRLSSKSVKPLFCLRVAWKNLC